MSTVLDFSLFADDQGNERDSNIHDSRHRAKRLRLNTVNTSEYQPGAIIKLRVQNFVTYSYTEFHLSPSLNMIIGPNGSGKSTFVCAVCLGLVGKPEFIGRAKKVEDFIKNGTEQSTIEITLKNSDKLSGFNMISCEDDVVVMKRVITRGKRKSEYFVNALHVDEDVAKSIVSALNIQLDNLCQFLSQERVEEFARLKPDKLLLETIRSVDVELLDVFNKLISLENSWQDEKQKLEVDEVALNKLLIQKEGLEKQVEALELYESTSREREIHERLLIYANVKEHREKNEALKSKYKKVQKEVKILERELKPYLDMGKKLKETETRRQEDFDKSTTERGYLKTKFDDLTVKLKDLSQKIADCKARIQYFKNRNVSIKSSIQQLFLEIETYEEKKRGIPSPDPREVENLESQISDVVKKKSEAKDEITDYENKIANINFKMKDNQNKLSQKSKLLNSTDRIYLLDKFSNDGNRAIFRELKEAVRYLRSIPEARHNVLEPPIISVSAKDKAYAAYLAACVDFNTMTSLTMIDRRAYETFSGDFVQRFKVNIREVSDEPIAPIIPREELSKYGFEGYLNDFVTGDEHVIKMLCQQQKIHMIPVSKRPLAPELLESLKTPKKNGHVPFVRFIEGSSIHNVKQSEYGQRQTYSTSGSINFENQFFRADVMSTEQRLSLNNEMDQIKKEGQKLEAKISKMRSDRVEKQQHYNTLNENQQALNVERGILMKSQNSLKSIDDRIERLKKQIQEYRQRLQVDASGSVEKAERQLDELYQKEQGFIHGLTELIAHLQNCDVVGVTKSIEIFDVKTKIEALSKICDEKEKMKNDKLEEALALREDYERNKNTEEFRIWMAKIAKFTEEEKDVLNEYATKYTDENTFTSIFINGVIDRLSSELSMMNNDVSAIHILKETKERIDGLKRTIPPLSTKVADIYRCINETQEVFEPKLQWIVEKISQKFSALFCNVGSAGEVRLLKTSSFSEWTIEIKVKFRDDAELQQLNPHIQSGGERAVSTVLYMIALQEFTTAPFRVVDEINQGMDQRNERVVHKIMVENACATGTSQYFLITPKLLTDLYYHERMRVHCVFAGSWIPNPSEHSDNVHFGEVTSYKF